MLSIIHLNSHLLPEQLRTLSVLHRLFRPTRSFKEPHTDLSPSSLTYASLSILLLLNNCLSFIIHRKPAGGLPPYQPRWHYSLCRRSRATPGRLQDAVAIFRYGRQQKFNCWYFTKASRSLNSIDALGCLDIAGGLSRVWNQENCIYFFFFEQQLKLK